MWEKHLAECLVHGRSLINVTPMTRNCLQVWVRELHNNLQIAIYIHTKGEGNGHPLQYPCLENPMDKGAWRATVHGVAKSQTQLSDSHTHTHTHTHTYILSHIISSSYWWWVGVLQGKTHSMWWARGGEWSKLLYVQNDIIESFILKW